MSRVLFVSAIVCLFSCSSAQAQPSVPQFEQTLNARLQQLRPDGTTERDVLFQQVTPGAARGGIYPFQATLLIRDYGPGYPKNQFYGETCVARMEKWTFEMRKDDFGGWIVEGRMTPDQRDCKRNPSAGVSAVPLSALSGTQASTAPAASAAPRGTQPASATTALPMGEYACYGTGSRLMAGMGFKLSAGGRYNDVDGKRGGTYAIDAAQHTIAFKGGFLDGQVGKQANSRGFALTATVSCEPWK